MTGVKVLYGRLRRYGNRLFDTLDSELVAFYQMLFYLLVFLQAVQSIVFNIAPPDALEETLDPALYNVWVAGAILSPIFVGAGKWMHGKYAKSGAIFELVGDIGFCGISAVWCVAIYSTQWGDKVLFASTYVFAAVLCAMFFVIRDIRRLRERGRWVKP